MHYVLSLMSCQSVSVHLLVLVFLCGFWASIVSISNTNNIRKKTKLRQIPSRLVTCVPMEKFDVEIDVNCCDAVNTYTSATKSWQFSIRNSKYHHAYYIMYYILSCSISEFRVQ